MSQGYSVCNECRILNKFDLSRSGRPICGKCKKPLPIHGAVTEATGGGLSRLIESSPIPVVTDFWAPWCGPCRAFAPTFESTARQWLGKAVFAKVNTETEPSVGQTYGIRGIPTLIVFANAKELNRISGALDASSLNKWLTNLHLTG